MDRWEAAIEDYQRSQTLDSFSSVLHTAELTLKDDLAQFELDWYVQTLVSEPVLLLDTITARSSDEAWLKVVRDAYKLLSAIVESQYESVQMYVDDIISVCQKQLDARTRTDALHCLTSCMKRTQPGALASQYIAELGHASSCKGPLALLVGTICEYHPEEVAHQTDVLWRNYLNLLESNKNSDLLCKSLLRGVWGLFKHFGNDIPVNELSQFYDKLTREYLNKCESAVLPILRDYPSLFKEKLASDVALRRELWTLNDLTPLVPVYREATSVLTTDDIIKMVRTEIAPMTTASYAKLKFTALRVCAILRQMYDVCVEDVINVDVYSLEFELRKEVSYEVAEAVSWCIEFNMGNSEKLLQTAIMFYQNLPANKRKEIVVNGLLNAPSDIMNTTLNFLITETCQQEDTLLTYLPLWKDIFDSQNIDKKRLLFENFTKYVVSVIENFLDEDSGDKKIPDKLATLLTLTSHVLTLQPVEDYTSDECALISSKLVELSQECGLEACVVAVARSTLKHCENDAAIGKIYEMIQIDKCKDEALLCESCLAVIHASKCGSDPDVVLKASEIILSRIDAEPKTLSLAMKKLEELIDKGNSDLNKASVSKCIQLIGKLRSRKDMVGKDARVLQRDINIFLGKYFNLECTNNAVKPEDNMLIVKLKDVLTLELPNPIEGTTYKINLNRILHLALTQGDEDSLRMLLNIICASLCNNNSPLLQVALGRVVVSLCRATVGATQQEVARHAAVSFCAEDATLYILQQISEEKSPAVRRMLSDTIEGILLKDPGSEANEKVLKTVFSEVCLMMKSNCSTLKLGGLDITESLLTALKVNRHQTKRMLPTLLLLISSTNEEDSRKVFENASKLFMENIGLFSAEVLDSTISNLLKILLNPNHELIRQKEKAYKDTVKYTLKFVSEVIVSSKEIYSILFDMKTNSDTVKLVYVMSEIPKVFDVKEDVKEVLDLENGAILEKVFREIDVDSVLQLDAHLSFVNNYASVLLKYHSATTLDFISRLLKKLPPKYVKSHRKHLSECLTHCRQICQTIPRDLLKSFASWTESLPIAKITEYVEKEKFITDHAMSVNSLRIMLEIFSLEDPTSVLTTVSSFAKTWTKTVLKLFASPYFKYHKKHVPFLTDLLSVSLSFLTATDVKQTLREGHSLEGERNDRLGVEFGRFFMSAFVKYLVKEPFLLVQDGMECCWVLVYDVVKWSVRKRWDYERMHNVLKLVDQLWPTIESKATFKAKHRLLIDLTCFNVKLAHSRPMRWATAVVGSNEAERDDRIALVSVLAGGEAYSETYRQYASLLPTRLSDMDGTSRPVLRALLDALAGNADMTLLNIVITLADGDNTAGWWDEALASCMASLAARPITLETLVSLYTRCRSASLCVCQRLLVPLLRCSPSSLCEKFFASILKDVLEGLSSGLKAPSLSPEYRACVTQKTIILDILLLVFEKLPASKIESPSSPLYDNIQTDKPWYLAREIMRLCYKLRDKLIVPTKASTDLSDICREFQQAAYKCMCASVCARRPDAHIYDLVFNVCVWNNIVDQTLEYQLPLKTEWNRQKVRKAVSIVTGGGRDGASSAARSLSRSRVFLRTLSENPLEYDLIHNDGDTNDIQDVELAMSSLNEHSCAATLTALFQHSAELDHCQWRSVLCEALVSGSRNVRWLLAQAICNCKEDLKAHASALRPGLLAVIADTAQEGCNSLHIDILNTLINWGGEVSSPEIPHLNTTVNSLARTALNNTTRTNIFRMLEDVLENMLRIYGSNIEGNLKVYEDQFDDPTKTKWCLKLMLLYVKHNVRIASLLPYLLAKLDENHKVYSGEMGLLAEVIGTLISNSNKHEKVTAAAKLKKVLEEIRKIKISNYVKMLYYSGICDVQQLRIIVDLTQKLLEADKKKCLRIISTYICAHSDANEVSEIPANIRQMADEVSVDRQFEELFTPTTEFMPPPAKRGKVDKTSPILNTIGRNEKYIAEVLTRLGHGKGNKRSEKMGEKLCKNNMAVRFVECFYIAIYLPIRYQWEKTDLSACTSEFFQILFSHLKAQENFKDKKLRDEPWTIVHPIGLTKSRSKRTVGTLRSFSYTSYERNEYYESEQGIDVQVSIEKILDTFVQFAKVTPEVTMELLTQLLRCLKDRGFDPRFELSHLLSTLLKTAPELVVIARECVDQLCLIHTFTGTADELMKSTIGSEGEQLFRLLREETRLRCDDTNLFVMGSWNKIEDMAMSEDVEFSIEGLVSAFQKLSNWDEVTLRDRRQIEASLPLLWTDSDQSKLLLHEYTVSDASGWFGQTVQLYRENRKDAMKWLRLIDKWPRRHFVVSAIIEAMQWRGADMDTDSLQLPCDIQRSDCLVEWAARLSLRTAYLTDIKRWDTMKLSRSHELIWCERANEMGLHNSALSVIQRNCVDLEKDEILQWMEQKMIALTMIGTELSERSQLEKALAISSSVDIAQFYQHSNIETIVGVNMLVMRLNYKLESLSSSKVEDIMTVVEEQVNRLAEKEVPTIKNKKSLAKLHETAVLYYDGLWDQCEFTKDEILVRISDCLGRLSEWNIDGASIAAILLNRLDECDVISDKAAVAVLAKMKMISPSLPPCYIDLLKAKISIFPPQVIRTYAIKELQGESVLEMFKKCMQLLGDADYMLLQYCHELQTTLQTDDASKWDAIFERMMDRIFKNEYAGTDYEALTKYRSALDNIRVADSNMKRIVLSGIIQDLRTVPARETIRLSHVCPSLVHVSGRGLERLLRLPAGVIVVKIEEELRVFTDSVRRPCVVCVLCSDGRRRRYLSKSEDLRADASVGMLTHAGGYTVIPLSEDCGLIEFLEDHKRIRELIANISITRQAAKENELILAPRAASVQNYSGICKKIPAYALRSAIENHSSSVQDFIAKKLRFLETLGDMTIANWLFGLGDRHLENILYSMQDGGVQCIDWGAIFQYGVAELPPARLTRNMLAVCDPRVLESRLQNKLSFLRESHQVILPVLKLAFRWMDKFSEKLVYIEGILKGTMLAHTITKDVIQKSDKLHKTKYNELLDVVFADYHDKDSYSVEEQVSSLLLHSTDPWILSVTGSNWEPWL